jgi:predicted acetyltransferase
MKETTIREIHGDEMLEIVYRLDNYAFRATPPLPDKESWTERVKLRKGASYLALFEDDRAVACAGGSALIQQVRGELFPMGGIFDVVTEPAARRKGYSRQLVTRLLADLRQDGKPVSCLYPFRESFYERLGYAVFPQPRKVKFDTAALEPLLERDLGGEVEVMLIADGYDAYRDFLQQLQHRVHGMAFFAESQKESVQQSNNSWLALARVAGEPVGLMLYDIKGDEIADFNLRAMRFYYHTSQGKYLLLDWIARHIDQAVRVEIWLPPYEHPGTWLADMRPKYEPTFFAPMGRVLDVAGIGGMHTGSGCFSVRIADPICPWNEGVWQFETVAGVLQVSPGDQPDCDLGVQALAALVYGTHDPADFSHLGWGDPTPDTQEVMRLMFPPRVPYLHEYY